jgi:hypothetical protein
MTPAKDYAGSANEPVMGQSLISGLELTRPSNLRIGFKILIADRLQVKATLARGLTYSQATDPGMCQISFL